MMDILRYTHACIRNISLAYMNKLPVQGGRQLCVEKDLSFVLGSTELLSVQILLTGQMTSSSHLIRVSNRDHHEIYNVKQWGQS